jgi:hypothetical protein
MESSRTWRIGVVILLAASIAQAQGPKAASINIGGCSGTVIRRIGDQAWGVSAAHCAGEVGSKVSFTTPAGKSGTAIWRAIDKDLDLALFSCQHSDVDGYAAVPPTAPEGSVTGWGYPRKYGLSRTSLRPKGFKAFSNLSIEKWSLDVLEGHFRDGNSGGGVFIGGKLVAVQTHGEDDEEIVATGHDDLYAFLVTQEKKLKVDLVEDRPPLTGPLKSDKDRTAAIEELRRLLLDSKGKPGQPGPPGPAGPPGSAGKDSNPELTKALTTRISELEKRVSELEKWRKNFKATLRVKITPRKKE